MMSSRSRWSRIEPGAGDTVCELTSVDRVHEFITAHVPLEIELLVPSPASSTFRSAFLNRLS